MNLYFLSIGSNIEPEQNVPKILDALLNLAGELTISRILRTEPVDMRSGNKFLNLCAAFKSPMDSVTLRKRFDRIETALGRDRSNPDRQYLDRPADVDILFFLTTTQKNIDQSLLPQEMFILPLFLELIDMLGFESPVPLLPVGDGVEITLNNQRIGKSPVTLNTVSRSRPQG